MRANYDIYEFISECSKRKVGEITIYTKDGIRYIDKPGVIITNAEISVDQNEVLSPSMEKSLLVLEHLGLFDADLARELNVSRNTVKKYKGNDIRMSTADQIRKGLMRLCEKRTDGMLYLSMTVDELFY